MPVTSSLITLGSVLDVISLAPAWLSAVAGVIAAASAVTALTPTPRDDRFIGKVYRVLEILALNIGHAKDLPPNSGIKQ